MADQNDLVAAVEAARAAPDNDEAWDEAEGIAGELDAPDPVALAYREILAGDLDTELILSLGERAAQFHEEWYSEDRSGLVQVLARMLEVDPASQDAFQRLSVTYTVAEEWDALIALYDDTIAALKDDARRMQLLDEAASVAKDVAHKPEKAIEYLQRLLPLRPDDSKLATNLERLLERHERWRELIALWETLLEDQRGSEREATRARIARCWIDNLSDPAQALAAVEPLLAEAKDDGEACSLLRQILESDAAESVRAGALDLLRSHYESTERPREVVAVLETAIQRAEGARLQSLHEEAAHRLAELGEEAAATSHYAVLLALNPMSSVVQEQLRQLAQRSGNWEAYATGVAAAGAECPDTSRRVGLLAEAARTRLDYLEDERGAIELYQRALAEDDIGNKDVRVVTRRLSELLASADRNAERLDVLERLASVETTLSRKRAVLGDAARLAESLGETDRALAAWAMRIEIDPNDGIAVDGMIDLLERAQRWEPLIEALDQRIVRTQEPREREIDMVRIATVYARELGNTDKAIEAWLRVQSEHGETLESTDALAELFATAERWTEMSELLERASGRETARVADRLSKLADAQRSHLGAPARALEAYRQILLIDSRHEGARAGLTGLLDDDELRAVAAVALLHSYRANADWDKVLELVEPRLAQADDDGERLVILREAAEISERRQDDKTAALAFVVRAMPLAPRDRRVEDDVVRLAGDTGDWQSAIDAYRATAAVLKDDPIAAARLRFQEATLLENRVGNVDEAYTAYSAVVVTEPHNLEAVRAVARIGAARAAWDQVAGVVMAFTRSRRQIEEELFTLLTDAAEAAGEWDALVRAIAIELSSGDLPGVVSYELWRRLAVWQRDKRSDEAAAIGAFRKALSFDPGQPGTLRELAALQEAQPDRAYYDTLVSLIDLDASDLDLVKRAADVAAQHLDDRELTRQAVTKLLGRATAAWRGSIQATSSEPPEALVRWSLDQLVDDHVQLGNAQAAIDLLVDASRMPFSQDMRIAFRVRAAEVASQAGNTDAAIEMYRGVIALAPRDTETLDKLARLYEAQNRTAELLSLRKHELGLVEDPERLLGLRLEVARLVGEVERQGGRLEALRANLADRPGHAPSIEALCELLDAKAQHTVLADILEEQATRLEALDDGERAAALWTRVATISEKQLEDLDRAIEGHRRAVALLPNPASFDALAHLHLSREQPALAVQWFERCLQHAEPKARPPIVLELAHAHLAADQSAQAISALEAHLGDNPAAPDLRELLADLYRASAAWEPLARLLTRSLPLLRDDATTVAYASEAAAIYSDRLNMPDKAIPALEKALAANEGDRELEVKLAIGLRVAGRLDEARELLAGIIKSFGRRKSAERAAVHVELALVAKAEGEGAEALKELERASKMDQSNPRIKKMVADLYLVNGQPEDAEKTLRALLLMVRRQPPGDNVETVGSSEVLYELHKIAASKGDDEQSSELLESALEAATQSDAEVRRLRRSLEAHGDAEVLVKALGLRLDAAEETESQASLLTELAGVLDGQLHRSADALDAQLRAIDLIPDRIALHDQARELAAKAGQVERYVECVERTVDKLRRQKDAPLVSSLLMEAGGSLERDAGDLDRALELYRRVEDSGERVGEALFAIARVAGVKGDSDEKLRALDKLLELATTGESGPAQTEALYRIAEVFVESDDRRERGVSLLAQAFAAEPRFAQAGAILRVAADAEPYSSEIMALYEKVARGGGDWEMLLDFLERRARLPESTPAEVKEAVDLALEHDKRERGEALLERAVASARATEEGIASGVWAAIALAEARANAGEMRSARDIFMEIADVADPDRIAVLGLRIAEMAAQMEDSRELATEMYEYLRQREPAARHIWEPLVVLYRAMGDHQRTADTIASTLPNLVDPAERNALRMQHARHLIDGVGDTQTAVEVLRDLLLDDPDHLEGAAALEQVLRDSGDQEGLADFLWQRFEDAKDRRNPDTVTDVANRLGRLLDEMGSGDAATVYRQALDIAPESRDLLRAVIAHLDEYAEPTERAGLNERLLAVEDPDQAIVLTARVFEMYEGLENEAGMQRALELGFARSGDTSIRQQLETWYRDRQQYRQLGEMMAADADRLAEDHPEMAVARLREAAEVQREMLNDAGAAAGLLQRARRLAPSHEGLVSELVSSLLMAGERQTALAVLGETLGEELADASRVNLLMARADLRAELGDLGGSVEDLEEAYLLDREHVTGRLMGALEQYRNHAQHSGNSDGERAATLRLGELMRASGQGAIAAELISAWVERSPTDRDALYFLRDLAEELGDQPALVVACARLVHVDEGPEQIDAALRLADAAEKAEQPEAARQGLEAVNRAQPQSQVVRDKLRRIYELAGAYHELATLLLAEGDHSEDEEVRYNAYRKASEVFLMSLGDAASAMEPAEKARALRPEDHDTVTMYVDVLTGAGRIDDAVDVLEPAIAAHKRRSPELAALQQRRARIAAAQGDQEGHLSWLKKAFDVDRKNGEIAAELAQLATEMGDYDLALKPLRAITLMEDPQPITRQMALLWEAKIEHARGNHAKAELWAKKALREDPDYADAQQFLQEITG